MQLIFEVLSGHGGQEIIRGTKRRVTADPKLVLVMALA